MGLGDTARKIQKVGDIVEELYAKFNDLRDQVAAMRDTIESTHDRVGALEAELDEQRAILEAIAEEEGVTLPEAATADSTGDEPAGEATGNGSTGGTETDETETGEPTGDDPETGESGSTGTAASSPD